MGLKKFLRSLVGGQGDASDNSEGFYQAVDSTGVNFYLEQKDFNALQAGSGNTTEKVQLIVLNMMLEQGLAEPIANGFHVTSENISGLDAEQADILCLPPPFQGGFQAEINGRTGNSGFRVQLSVEMPDGMAPLKRKGPFLYLTSTERYLLAPAELMGITAWEYHEQLLPDQRSEAENLRLMAKLQTAARSGMRVDLSHFDRLDVVVPDDIGVTATRLPDGSLQLCPNLGDGSTPESLERRWAQLDMSADGGVLRIDNRVVLLDSMKMDGIRNVLAVERIPPDKVAEFIATPTAFLDAALVNLEVGFSVRVAGIGKPQHMDFGPLDATKSDWFALDGRPSPPEIIAKLVQTPEELERFESLLKAANKQDAETLSFADEIIDISNEKKVEELLCQLHRKFRKPAAPGVKKEAVTEAKENVAVILKEAGEINSNLLQKANNAHLLHTPDWSAYPRQPFSHQYEGIEWMLKLMGAAFKGDAEDLYRVQGGLLADDMGLGKTYMALVAVAEYLALQARADKPQKPVLVVAPLSLLENWEDEVSKTFNNMPFRDVVVLQSNRDLQKYRVKGAERESVQLASLADDEGMMDPQSIRYALTIGPEAGVQRLDMSRRLVITTYHTLRDYQFSLCKIDWGVVIFDEAQNIKNPNALQTRAAKGLKADFKLLVTGTPVENSLGDFWCLMDTAQPGLLGGWENFRDTWIKPILAASDSERDAVRAKLGEQLRSRVGVFMLRRVKEDQLKGLPTKTVRNGVKQTELGSQDEYAPELGAVMKGAQLRAYDGVLDDYRVRRANDEDMRGLALTALTELRSISLHPRLRDEASLYTRDAKHARQVMMESGKLASMLQLLDQIREKKEKVILFMMTKSLQRVLKYWLEQIYELDIAIINGDTKAVATKTDDMTRKKLITKFEAQSGFGIIIMSPVAAGVGLTVVGANHVVHIERHWNPAKEAQASDRIYRIGQEKDVFIHYPAVMHPDFDSFDVHLDNLLRGKLMLRDAVVTTDAVSESQLVQSMGL